jgi:hypothetical protein
MRVWKRGEKKVMRGVLKCDMFLYNGRFIYLLKSPLGFPKTDLTSESLL